MTFELLLHVLKNCFVLPTLPCSLFTSSLNKVRPLMSAVFLASSTKTSFGQLGHGIGEFGDIFFSFLATSYKAVNVFCIRTPHHISHVVHQYTMIYQSLWHERWCHCSKALYGLCNFHPWSWSSWWGQTSWVSMNTMMTTSSIDFDVNWSARDWKGVRNDAHREIWLDDRVRNDI